MRQPPRILTWASGVVLLACVTMSLVGGWVTGISWDEPFHVFRLNELMASGHQTGWYVLPPDIDALVPGQPEQSRYVYGPVAMWLLHLWTVVCGGEPLGEVSASAHAYALRHLGTTLISVLGVVAVAATARVLMRSWRWGLVAAAVLVATPMWTGHAMWNLKDIPVASGFAMASFGLVVLARLAPSRRRAAVGIVALASGAILMVGTRPGMWTGLMACVAAWGVGCLHRTLTLSHDHLDQSKGHRWRPLVVSTAYVVLALGAAWAALWAIYPRVFGNPHGFLVSSVSQSADYNDVPGTAWWIPANIFTEVPWLLLCVGVVGLVTFWSSLLAVVLGKGGQTGDAARVQHEVVTAYAVLAAQAIVLPTMAIIKSSSLYGGLRQVLFMAPAMSVFAALGLAVLCCALGEPRKTPARGRWRARVVIGLAVAAVVVPTVDQARYFPYNYAWAAPIPDALGLGYTTDYWRTSVRALAPDVPVSGRVVCSPMRREGRAIPYRQGVATDCLTDPVGPLLPWVDEASAPALTAPGTFAIVDTGGYSLPSNCRETASVSRWAHLASRSMGYVAICDWWFPESGAVRTIIDSADDPLLMPGWAVLYGGGIATYYPLSEVGVQIPASVTTGIMVTFDRIDANAGSVSVNGGPALPLGHNLFVTPQQLAAWQGRLLLQITVDQPGTSLAFRNITITPAPAVTATRTPVESTS